MLRKNIIIIGLLSLGISFQCKKEVPKDFAATVGFIKGKVTVAPDNSATVLPKELKLHDKVYAGDIIQTSGGAIAILQFSENSGVIEIQEKTNLKIAKFDAFDRELFMTRGSSWLKVDKLSQKQTFQLRTLATVAAVRGTKFFTFLMPNDITGTCHCEGAVDFRALDGSYSKIHQKDFMTFSKNGKVITLLPEDLRRIEIPTDEEHRHSRIDDSAVGPKEQDLTDKQSLALMRLINERFQKIGVK